MDLIYPINLVGHEEWVESGFEPALASGDVITRDGEFIGIWRVADYFLEDDYLDRAYEFLPLGSDLPMFYAAFGLVDSRTSRGLAQSRICRGIREWHDAQDS